MLVLIRFCLLIGSITGYLWLIVQKLQIRLEFAPALVCAWVSNLLFMAGILNFMPEMAGILFLGGYISFLYCMSAGRSRIKQTVLQKRNLILYAVFLIALLYFAVLIRGVRFTHYDDFSHWALVVRDMLLKNRMPNFEDEVIGFQSYPLGSGLLIYYVCRIIGSADSCLIWAQMLMLVSFLFCMAAFVKKNNWYGGVLIALFSIWSLTANNGIYNLLVDTLLPITGIAAFSILYAYRDSLRKAAYGSLGLLILLVNMKKSGLFFYAVCVLILGVYVYRFHGMGRRHFVSSALIPLIAVFLWKKHVSLVFLSGLMSKHSMNIKNYAKILSQKSAGDMELIGRKMAERILSLSGMEIKMLLLTTCLILLVSLDKDLIYKALLRIAANWVCAAVYIIFLYAMYIFSMPLTEALNLASYDRYMLTAVTFVYGMTIIYVIEQESLTHRGMIAMSLLLTAYPAWHGRQRLAELYQRPDYMGTDRYYVQKIMETDRMEMGKSCIIYRSEQDSGYLSHMMRYELWSKEVTTVVADDFEDRKREIADYEYFLVWDWDENVQQYLDENGLRPDQVLVLADSVRN